MRALALAFLVSASAGAQDLAARVAAVGSGTVRLQFAADSGVCGNGRGNISIRRGDGRAIVSGENIHVNGRRAAEWEDDCEPGPVRVALDVSDRRVTAVRSYVGGRWRTAADLDLGEVSPTAARDYLMQLAATAESRAAKDAIFPALIADGPSPDAQLLAVAKDDARPRDVRSSATFWLSQSAGDRATAGLQELIGDPDREIREHAVFALSQRPNEESVPALIRLARTHQDPAVRRRAVFWLGQKRDPRALQYFEDVLLSQP
ncbi:HEAT repeat domain-containing protein [Pseudogemmatithrix spongiicola]|uniref:HEAT repeat domain-containing protein n=1 Tax=Pseudogemmatithrix spongiicola TaxID=3062599 RepID=A0AA49JSS1_9BACT|nr:HEAT repeat domain-containing protein [Gemmatimonadaceae bacterium 'strain 138']WKW14227.1 HEAT repeat domain-containing protein [Gemmatimonadaceae bacterium 'strain 318']